MRLKLFGLAIASLITVTACSPGPDGTYGGFQVTHTPAPAYQTPPPSTQTYQQPTRLYLVARLRDYRR